jgi:hypothetical protein
VRQNAASAPISQNPEQRDFLRHPQSSPKSQGTQLLYKRAVQKQIQVLLAMNSLGLLEDFLATSVVGFSNSADNLTNFSPACCGCRKKDDRSDSSR